MTTKVTITNDQANAPDISVSPIGPDNKVLGAAEYAPLLVRRVRAGETVSMYVHAGCRLLVTELGHLPPGTE